MKPLPSGLIRAAKLRRSFAVAIFGLIFACVAPLAFAQEPPQSPAPAPVAETLSEEEVAERVTIAIDRSLRYLQSVQEDDGRWDDNNAVNALAMLAFMGRGHTPGRGPYAELRVLERGRNFLLDTQAENGLFVSPRQSHGPMYEHALCTLALSEMYGMDADPKLEKGVRKAVDLIVQSQSENGGWRYQPAPGDHDLSVTVMQIVALRAANNAEIPVPDKTIKLAIDYTRGCGREEGGFGYQTGGSPNPQMTVAGILSLQLLGDPEDKLIPASFNYLKDRPVSWSNEGEITYFYYFHYYAIQAHYQAGGDAWNRWHPRIRELLLSKQNGNGSWDCPENTAEDNEGTVGRAKVYWTAMSTLVLEIYLHYLPAYQR